MPIDIASVLEQSARLCALLEPATGHNGEFRPIVRDLSRCLLDPLESAIDSCSELVITLPRTALCIPIDLLVYRRSPLCLKRPVSYRLGKTGNAAAHFQAPCSAFILSNGGVCGADPDRACLTVAARLDQVTCQDDRETTSQFLRFQSRKDVIVFSIHGYVGGKDPDHMAITSGPILPEDLTGLQPRLAYFDSCRLGISSAFLEHFRAMGTAYYVAPILRNEAGKSSTRTMIAFFEHLLAGESPEVALWLTRRELWQLYRECDRRKRWWRAFAFRVYRLN